MIYLYLICTEEYISSNKFLELEAFIPSDEKYKIERFKVMEDRKRSLYGKLLIRYIASIHMGISNKNIKIINNDYGKPYFKEGRCNHFNISHSGKWVIGAYSTQEIGVDIEVLTQVALEDMQQCFTPAEYIQIQKLQGYKRLEGIFELWTLKESYIKWKGMGLTIPLSTFSFELGPPIKYLGIIEEKLFFYQLDIGKAYKIAICTEKTEDIDIKQISIRDIYRRLSLF